MALTLNAISLIIHVAVFYLCENFFSQKYSAIMVFTFWLSATGTFMALFLKALPVRRSGFLQMVALLLVLVFMTGCATLGGAAIGSVAGGAIGAGANPKNPAQGALQGGLIGAGGGMILGLLKDLSDWREAKRKAEAEKLAEERKRQLEAAITRCRTTSTEVETNGSVWGQTVKKCASDSERTGDLEHRVQRGPHPPVTYGPKQGVEVDVTRPPVTVAPPPLPSASAVYQEHCPRYLPVCW